jgi:signal peptidase I
VLFFAIYASNWVVAMSFRTGCAEAFSVPTRSMAPTILPGDRLLVEKLTPLIRPPRRGDIVTYWPPTKSSIWIARVVAVPGDEIAFDDGRTIVNGALQTEPFAIFAGEPPDPADPVRRMPSRTLGSGEYFIVGDNRWLSNDSRLLGPIDHRAITGRLATVYWSTVVRQKEWQFDDMPDLDPGRPQGAIRWERIGLRPQHRTAD